MLGVINNLFSMKTTGKETLNSCGMPVFKLDPISQLKRFMFLGTEKGTYYITSNNLTNMHLESLEDILEHEAKPKHEAKPGHEAKHDAVIALMKEYNEKAFKLDYVIYVLARCCAEKNNTDLRKKAYALLSTVCKTPTHLFMFIEFYELIHKKLHGSTGWNKLQKQYISEWYLEKTCQNLTYLVTKYKNRNGWTHADVLRLAHVKPESDEDGAAKDCLFKYITKGYDDFRDKAAITKTSEILESIEKYIMDYNELMTEKNLQVAVQYITTHNFVREHIPTNLLGEAVIWNALLEKMPMIAMLRNLNKITALGVFEDFPDKLEKVVEILNNKETIKKSKAHPLQFLISLKMYASGKGDKGKLTWSPNKQIVEALNTAFKLSFDNVEATNKRYLLALDVSGSMRCSSVCGTSCLMASEASCAMAMVLADSEETCDIMGFNSKFSPLDMKSENSLEQNMDAIYKQTFGTTDCSLPMTWALDNQKEYDVMIVFTDSETNCNTIRPVDALRMYNEKMGLQCKLIVMGMAANNFSIADPNDPNMLDIAGFDASTPLCISEFVRI